MRYKVDKVEPSSDNIITDTNIYVFVVSQMSYVLLGIKAVSLEISCPECRVLWVVLGK